MKKLIEQIFVKFCRLNIIHFLNHNYKKYLKAKIIDWVCKYAGFGLTLF